MQALKAVKPKKIIQKRVARRERFARMSRIKHRKAQNVLMAKFQDLEIVPKYKPSNAIYENILGIVVEETDDGLDTELSMLNNCYIRNSVTVEDDTNKRLCVKVHKSKKNNLITDQRLEEWESRNNSYWGEWAKDFKQFRDSYQRFIDKYQDKFESNKLDKESIERQKTFGAFRDQLMATKPCAETRIRFNREDCAVTQVTFNSKMINKLNYDFEEFIQYILVEGFPKIRPDSEKGLKRDSNCPGDVEEYFFNNTVAHLSNTLFLTKNNNIKIVDFSVVMGGYFVKKAAEISFIIYINEVENLLDSEPITKPIHRLYMEQQMTYESERRYFLQTFYNDYWKYLINRPKVTCQIRFLKNESEDELEEENSSERSISTKTAISEELAISDNVDFNKNASNEEALAVAPYTDYLSQLMPQLKMMKNAYENKQKMLDRLLLDNIKRYMSKEEEI